MPPTTPTAKDQLRRVVVLPDADPAFERALLAVLRLPGALTPVEFARKIDEGRQGRRAP